MNLVELQSKSDDELATLGRQLGVIENGSVPRRQDLVTMLLQAYAEQDGNLLATGILSIVNDGYGFLKNGLAGPRGQWRCLRIPIADQAIQPPDRRPDLRTGTTAEGRGEVLRAGTSRGGERNTAGRREGPPALREAHPDIPQRQIKLETAQKGLSTRLMDLVAPVGRGQRGMIVSPPKAGKTTLLKQIANGITVNAPDIHLMVALIGERPEEVTDMSRSVNGEVFSSTFDEPVEDHCRVAELVLERSKRLVEAGSDVVVLLDSLTRLTRAYNLSLPTSGRTLSGGIDPVALYPPKRFFGAARNAEDGGSLTILAAVLVDTGSRMDDVIYEEFKGTGNMEVHLDRKLADRRVYPSIDITRSGTRREELLLDEDTIKQVWLLRRMVSMITSDSSMDSSEATEKVLERLRRAKDNAEFLANLGKDA